jgi:hypothetical protein
MMQSESARMTSGAEAAFRVSYPNSTPRRVKIIALDERSRALFDTISRKTWRAAIFFSSIGLQQNTSGLAAEGGETMRAWLLNLSGQMTALVDELAQADLVVMVTHAGNRAELASLIGEACMERTIMTTGVIIQDAAQSDETAEITLKAMRPYASMLVVTTGEDYVETMLGALQA